MPVVVTREPGGTAIGERIREILLDPESLTLSDRAEALLYAAARAQHVAEVIEPALAAGKVVLCDRFIDSSIVYQGAGAASARRIEELNLWATGQVVADLIVLLDVAVEEGLRRAGADGTCTTGSRRRVRTSIRRSGTRTTGVPRPSRTAGCCSTGGCRSLRCTTHPRGRAADARAVPDRRMSGVAALPTAGSVGGCSGRRCACRRHGAARRDRDRPAVPRVAARRAGWGRAARAGRRTRVARELPRDPAAAVRAATATRACAPPGTSIPRS
jgi:hypothetical protein